MKKILANVLMLAMVVTPMLAPLTADAISPSWNVVGTYVWDVFGTYQHDFVIDVQNPDGTFTGHASYPAVGYPIYPGTDVTTEVVTGQVTGNDISFHVVYNGPFAPGSTFDMTGTIDANGNITGTTPWNWSLLGGAAHPIVAVNTTVVVRHVDLATSNADVTSNPTKWLFYNDETDTVDNTLGSFVVGPDTAPLGSGSAQVSVNGSQRRNLATYQFAGTHLSEITQLKFSTYNPSFGNGGSATRSAYLHFNVSFDGVDSWQRRLVYVPSTNGPVVQNSWQVWDAIDNGNAKWVYSGANWPGDLTPGSNPKTWNEILAQYPNIKIRDTDSFLGLRVGEPYADGYTENIDKFVFGTNAEVKTFDFEPTASPVCPQGTVKSETAVETVTVPSDMPTDTLTSGILSNGKSYILKAYGTADAGDGIVFDAKYSFRTPTSQNWSDSVSTYESYGPELLDLYYNNTSPWGSYNGSHEYEAIVVGSDAKGAFKVNDAYYPNNVGNIKVDIYSCDVPGPTTGSITITKTTTGGDGTFNFVGGAGAFSITTTGGTGVKTISDLNPGTYSITELSQSGWNQNSNTCDNITVVAGQTATCTVTNTKQSSISGMKYNDLNRNGKKDTNEPGLSGWKIRLILDNENNNDDDDTVVATVTTDSNGNYTFSDVAPGTYEVRETHQKGWKRMSKNPKDIVITVGTTVTNIDFGNAQKKKEEKEDSDKDDNRSEQSGKNYGNHESKSENHEKEGKRQN